MKPKYLLAPRGEKRICCPFCGEKKYKCYLNKEKGVGHCFRCGKGFLLQKLKFACKKPLISTLLAKKKKLKEVVPKPLQKVSIFSSLCPEKVCSYALSRVTEEESRLYDFSSMPNIRKYKDRLILPVAAFQYFQGRAVNGEVPKYLNPLREEVQKRKSEVVWGVEYMQDVEVGVLCEGIFSAIAIPPPFRGVAILGKTLSPVQEKILISLSVRKWVVLLDPNAEKEAISIALSLSQYKEVGLVFLRQGDAATTKKEELSQLIKESITLSLKTLLQLQLISKEKSVIFPSLL